MSSAVIEKPILSEEKWNYPLPLIPALNNAIPYPFYALPTLLQPVVRAYQCYGQQPLALVACGALANVSLACQSASKIDPQSASKIDPQ